MKAALVTGAAAGIGRHLAIDLAAQGYRVTVVDYDFKGAQQTVAHIKQAGGEAQCFQCDVCNDSQQEHVFQQHMQAYHQLDLAVLNAGVSEMGDIIKLEGSGWQKTLDVDLRAAMVGARLAARAMLAQGTKGVILVTASAGGLFPMPLAPVYAAAKAGLVHFTRSLAPRLAKQGIRLCALCPQQVDTAMTQGERAAEVLNWMKKQSGGGVLTTKQVVEAAQHLIQDDSRVGTILLVMARGPLVEWQPARNNLVPFTPRPRLALDKGREAYLQALAHWAAHSIPQHRRKLQVHRLSNDFAEATKIVTEPLPQQLPPGHVLIRNAYAGINASDVNYTAGRYFGSPQEAAKRLPFDAGFEAVGAVAAAASDVTGLVVGSPVAAMMYGSFSDYQVVAAKHVLPVPLAAKEVVALLTSGLTASIGLEQAGRMRTKETVLITAAAGGTGQFAVQLAKAAGNRVLATCGSDDKAQMLQQLGADGTINYKREDLKQVL